MREIKFRGKRLDYNEWRYGSLFVNNNNQCYIKEPDGILYAVENNNTIGQFTGLQDKNGAEVYEGDIIRVKEYDNQAKGECCHDPGFYDMFTLDELKGELEKEYVSAVGWEEGCFVFSSNGEYNDCFLSVLFGDMKRSYPIFEFEVIGNIYDNPELNKLRRL